MKLKLVEIRSEIENIKTFVFGTKEKLTWRAGQYLIYFLEHDNKDLRGKMRFFTISSPPYLKNPSITTRIEKNSSSFKKALSNMDIGDEIEVKGPDGDFIIENTGKNYVFIAGGIGITPFYAILKQLEVEKKDLNILLLYQNKNNKILFKEEIDKLNLKNLKIEHLTENLIDEEKIKSIKGFKNKIFYVSGPDPMVSRIEEILNDLKVAKENQYYDYFSGYKNI